MHQAVNIEECDEHDFLFRIHKAWFFSVGETIMCAIQTTAFRLPDRTQTPKFHHLLRFFRESRYLPYFFRTIHRQLSCDIHSDPPSIAMERISPTHVSSSDQWKELYRPSRERFQVLSATSSTVILRSLRITSLTFWIMSFILAVEGLPARSSSSNDSRSLSKRENHLCTAVFFSADSPWTC